VKTTEVDALIAKLTGPTSADLNAAFDATWENEAWRRRASEALEATGKELRKVVIKRFHWALRGLIGSHGKGEEKHYVSIECSDVCYILNHAERPRAVAPWFKVHIYVRAKASPHRMRLEIEAYSPKSLAEIDAVAAKARAAVEAWLA
jgi:hypothetical protein